MEGAETAEPGVAASANEEVDAEAAAAADAAARAHAGLMRMHAVGLDGPLRTWVAPPPLLSVEGQWDGKRWHVPVPDTSPPEWLCIQLPDA